MRALSLVLFFITCVYCYDYNKVLLRDVEVLTFNKNEYTIAGRNPSVPQLSCVGGTGRHFSNEIDVVQCYNKGYDGTDVNWKCESVMRPDLKLGKADVVCEGFLYPDDPYILKGSCSLEFELNVVNSLYKRFNIPVNAPVSTPSLSHTPSQQFNQYRPINTPRQSAPVKYPTPVNNYQRVNKMDDMNSYNSWILSVVHAIKYIFNLIYDVFIKIIYIIGYSLILIVPIYLCIKYPGEIFCGFFYFILALLSASRDNDNVHIHNHNHIYTNNDTCSGSHISTSFTNNDNSSSSNISTTYAKTKRK